MRTAPPPHNLPVDEKMPTADGPIFTPEGVANIIAYLEIVRSILERLLDEGYTIRDGQIIQPPSDSPPQ